jgi:hypothetical protein
MLTRVSTVLMVTGSQEAPGWSCRIESGNGHKLFITTEQIIDTEEKVSDSAYSVVLNLYLSSALSVFFVCSVVSNLLYVPLNFAASKAFAWRLYGDIGLFWINTI